MRLNHFLSCFSEAWHDIWNVWTKKAPENTSYEFYFSEDRRSSFRFVLMMLLLIVGLVVIDVLGYFIFGKKGGHNYILTVPSLISFIAIPTYFLAKALAYHTHWFPKVTDRTSFAIIAFFVLTVFLTILIIVFV